MISELLLEKLNLLLENKDFVILGIEGKSASGKTTLASELGKIYDCNIFHMDDFFLTPELRTDERLREVGGNVDYVRFEREVVQGIFSKSKFRYHVYNCHNNSLTKSSLVSPKKLNIVEGSYSMHPAILNSYDLKVYVNIDKETQSKRILIRNGAEMYDRFINEWIPKENEYLETMKIPEQCDLIITKSREIL